MPAQEIKSLLAPVENVVFAYLFGSYADGTFSQESDVDVAVYLDDTSLDAQLSLRHSIEKTLRKKVDLLILNQTRNIYLLENILDHGIPVKDHPKRLDFEVRKQHEILDFKQFKRYIDAA